MLRARKRKGFGWTRWSRQWLYETLRLFNGYPGRRPLSKVPPAGSVPSPLWRNQQDRGVREIRTLRATWRGLETWHGRDGVTLANERARQQGTQTSTYTGAPGLHPTHEQLGANIA